MHTSTLPNPTTVRASAPRGQAFICGDCGGRLFVTHKRRLPTGVIVRYLRCQDAACDSRFKTVERLVPIFVKKSARSSNRTAQSFAGSA